jgi:hypothetical protein
MTQSSHDRAKPAHAAFHKCLARVPRVFNILDNNGEAQAVTKGNRSFKVRAIAVALNEGTKRNDVKKFVENTLIPSIVKIGGKDLNPDARPKWNDETSYKIVKSFNAILNDQECLQYVRFGYCQKKGKKRQKFPTPKQFFHASKGNLYSFWPVGKVPVAIIDQLSLNDKNLHARDSKAARKATRKAVAEQVETDKAEALAKKRENKILANEKKATEESLESDDDEVF